MATEKPCEIVPNCPVCFSPLLVAHEHAKLKICVCRNCGTSLSIPDDAWSKARVVMQKEVSKKVV